MTSRKLGMLAVVLVLGACSMQRLAIKALSDSLISGGSIFESDDDPILIGEAMPLALKVIEGLLEREPDNEQLALAAARGYTLYAYITVGSEEERVRLENVDAARALRQRARNLYLRAHGYAIRALAAEHPGIDGLLQQDPVEGAATLSDDTSVEALYWSAATLGLAISSARNEPALLARLPEVESLLGRALELDEAWDDGSLHEFAISFAAANPTSHDPRTLEAHYRRALALSRGQRASLYVAYAEAVALPAQDRAQFVSLLDDALAVDVDRDPSHRLLNVIAQQRARWLLGRLEELFL
jgi:predicted anti-sigma-YlaC factor YlaD